MWVYILGNRGIVAVRNAARRSNHIRTTWLQGNTAEAGGHLVSGGRRAGRGLAVQRLVAQLVHPRLLPVQLARHVGPRRQPGASTAHTDGRPNGRGFGRAASSCGCKSATIASLAPLSSLVACSRSLSARITASSVSATRLNSSSLSQRSWSSVRGRCIILVRSIGTSAARRDSQEAQNPLRAQGRWLSTHGRGARWGRSCAPLALTMRWQKVASARKAIVSCK